MILKSVREAEKHIDDSLSGKQKRLAELHEWIQQQEEAREQAVKEMDFTDKTGDFQAYNEAEKRYKECVNSLQTVKSKKKNIISKSVISEDEYEKRYADALTEFRKYDQESLLRIKELIDQATAVWKELEEAKEHMEKVFTKYLREIYPSDYMFRSRLVDSEAIKWGKKLYRDPEYIKVSSETGNTKPFEDAREELEWRSLNIKIKQ